MSERTYPYTAWVLSPSFKPKEVTFKAKYVSWTDMDYGDVSDGGKLYARSEIFPSKDDAIAAGWLVIVKQEADLGKRKERLEKRKAALWKAEAECAPT